MTSPPVTGGKAPARLRFNTTQTPEEDDTAKANDAYYRQSLLQLGWANADRIVHQRKTGGDKRPPPARCVQLAGVRGEYIARSSKYAGKPTPKATANQEEARRKHGRRVFDSFNSFTLRKRLGAPEPAPPEHPRSPEEGFGEDAIELATRGRIIAQKSMDTTPAQSYAQWISYGRPERQKNGPAQV